MSRTPARFTQADIARALKAIQQSGMNMAIEISTDGTIRIVPAASSKPLSKEEEAEILFERWERELKRRGRQTT